MRSFAFPPTEPKTRDDHSTFPGADKRYADTKPMGPPRHETLTNA